MGRTNYNSLIKEIYRHNPEISDWRVINTIFRITGFKPKRKTLASWKSRLRKEGFIISDRRYKDVENVEKSQ